jgi:hypothetical protein
VHALDRSATVTGGGYYTAKLICFMTHFDGFIILAIGFILWNNEAADYDA